MLDGKILAAVLATLTAIIVTTSGGEINSPQVPDSDASDFDFSQLMENPGQAVRDLFFPAPEPTNQVEAEIKASRLWEETIRVKDAKVEVSNLTSLELTSMSLESDQKMTFSGFNGRIEPSNLTTFVGRIQGVETSGVNISKPERVEFSVGTPGIEVNEAETDSLKFEEAEAVIRSGGSTHDLRNVSRTVDVSGFEGDISISPGQRSVSLEGKVGVIEAGSFSLGN